MKRISIVFIVFSLFIILIVFKLFYIQILAPDKFAVNNYLKTAKIKAERGKIFDVNQQPLVLNQTTYLLYVEPGRIEDKDKVIWQLDKILQLGEATLEAKLKSNKLWIPVVSGLAKEKRDQIAQLALEGLGFEEEQRRFYPEGSAAAHLTGFVGKTEEGDNIGYFGLEGYYEKDLKGLPGILKSERDLFGNPIFIGVQDKIEADNGRDLILSIDNTVQLIVKEKLKQGIERYGTQGGCIIVANPNTLELIAFACLPDFDPQEYYKFSEGLFKNPAISSVYEPGSAFKPLIMAAALAEGVVSPNDEYDEKGPIQIGQYSIRTWDRKYEGKISMTRILEKSSNVGIVYVGQKLGGEKILSYLKKYGFGQKTGIDLQGEVAGVLKPASAWYPIDYATVAFGQGIAVTPIQMIRAFSAIINGGWLIKPRLVVKLNSTGEKMKEQERQVERQVISEQTSIMIRRMLEEAVENGEAKWAKPEGYRIGGKTGTAQIPIKGHYDPTKTIASFIGFAPVDEPRFIALVMLREPTASPWGSETAAPLFFEVAKELFLYYNISPE